MKTLVTYHSESGNTEKIAIAIAGVFNTIPVKIDDVNINQEYDLLILGTPAHILKPNKKVSEFLDNLPQGKIKFGAAFCTINLLGGNKTCELIHKKMKEKQINYLDGLSCKAQSKLFGSIGPKIFNRGRPNEKDLERAREFAEVIKSEVEDQL
jgi:flavodoxin